MTTQANTDMQDTNTATDHSGSSQRARARRGFAVMDLERVRAIARMGGKAAHNAGTAHEFTKDEAKTAGKKGGLAPHKPRRTRKEMEAARAAAREAAQEAAAKAGTEQQPMEMESQPQRHDAE